MEKKSFYESPKVEWTTFYVSDVITTSGGMGDSFFAPGYDDDSGWEF